jgi:hypothetical protein
LEGLIKMIKGLMQDNPLLGGYIKACKISGFSCVADEAFVLLGCQWLVFMAVYPRFRTSSWFKLKMGQVAPNGW